MAELWALWDGLLLAKELGINNFIVDLDVLSVVLLMKNDADGTFTNWLQELIEDIS